jgi:hypothetical protein
LCGTEDPSLETRAERPWRLEHTVERKARLRQTRRRRGESWGREAARTGQLHGWPTVNLHTREEALSGHEAHACDMLCIYKTHSRQLRCP